MSKSNSKTDRITFITVKNNWLEAGQIKEIKMNKTMDVVQLHFEDGRLAEIHSCNPCGEGNGGLVLSDLVSLDNDLAHRHDGHTEDVGVKGGDWYGYTYESANWIGASGQITDPVTVTPLGCWNSTPNKDACWCERNPLELNSLPHVASCIGLIDVSPYPNPHNEKTKIALVGGYLRRVPLSHPEPE